MAKDYAKTKTSKQKQRSSSSANQESSEGRLWLLALVLFVLFVAGLMFLKHESKTLAVQAPAKPTSTQASQASTTTTPQPKFDFYSVLPSQQSAAPSQNDASNQTASKQGNTANASSDTGKSQIPAPSSDFSQPNLVPQTNATNAPSDNTDNSQAQDQNSQPTTSSASSSDSSNANASSDDSNADNSDTASPQEQVSDLVKQQLDQESNSSSSNCQHGIINPSSSNYILQLGVFSDATAADQQRAQLVIQGMEVKVKNIKKDGTTYYRIWMGPYKTKQDALKQQQQLQSSSVKSELIKQSN